jgi:hypothetical protein
MAVVAAIDTAEEDNWCTVATAIIDEGGENLADDFNDLVGGKTSGLNELNYSSDDNDSDYHQEIEDEAQSHPWLKTNKHHLWWSPTSK